MNISKFKLGASAIAFTVALTSIGSAASAQTAQTATTEPVPAADPAQNADTESALPTPPEGQQEEIAADIIVTGSSIRGVAPVGSNLVSVGQEALQKIAATTTSELVNTVPSISTANSTPQAQSAYSYYAPQIHQLAGSGSNSTLALIDGLRMPGGGTQYAQTDPNIIPTPALMRVEVLADGASSIYGSDAVAGVVNFITRKTYDGAQLNGKVAFADEYRAYDITGIWGTTWDTGGVYVAGQFLKQGKISNYKRDFLSRGDYRDIGGSNTNTFLCSPATIRNGTTNYINADSAATVPNNQAAEGFCNNSVYGTAIPGVERAGVLVVLNQEFGERFSFQGKLVYNQLSHFADGTPGTINAGTAFGPGSGRGDQINPFYRNPPGRTGTSQQVSYVALMEGDDYGSNNYQNETFYVTGVLEYKLTDEWTVTGSSALARSNSFNQSDNTYCAVCALKALNGSPTTSGNRTVVISPTETQVVSQALSADNALDVWNGVGTNRTSASTWASIYNNDTRTAHQNNLWQVKLEVQGPITTLPGGDLRMAAGGEYLTYLQNVDALTPNSTGNGYNHFISNLGPRHIKSGYVEFYFPVVSDDMDIPGIQSLDISLSGRIDHYSDWGSTKNPKIAANWQVNDWLKVRGNWATSFVAPPLNQIGDPSQGYLRGATGTGGSAVIDVPVSIYPNVVNMPGCAGLTAGQVCRVGANTGREGLDRSLGAGFAGVEPQKGKSWSVGVDLDPDFLPGFTANITYWTNAYRGGVNSPAQPLIINSAQLRDRLFICSETPGQACSDQQIRDFTNVANGATTNPVLPSPVYFLINRDVGNVLDIDVAGIDAQAQYRYRTDAAGTFTIGGTLTYFTKFDQRAPGGEWFDLLNTSGYNSQFPSIQTRGRAQLGWEMEGFALDLFANYTGKYKNYIQTSVIPVQLGPDGNPVGGGDPVKADLTFDLHASYELSGSFLNGSQVYLDVKNIFDKDPPFYNGNTTGSGVGAWGFNGFVSNLLGRLVSVGFRANF